LEPKDFDFGLIRDQLDTTLRALENKIEREWPSVYQASPNARDTLLIQLRLARNTYETIRYFAGTEPPDVFRRPRFLVSVPPLNRTILEAIFNWVFIFERFPERFVWYEKAGWRDLNEERERFKRTYEGLVDWAEYLAKGKDLLDKGLQFHSVTQAESLKPSSIPRWPLPSQIINHPVRRGKLIGPLTRGTHFIRYLHDWFYRDLSAMAHQSSSAMIKVGAVMLYDLLPVENQEQLDKHGFDILRGQQFGRTLTLIVCLASEVEGFFRFGFNQKFKYIWQILAEHIGEPKEIYDLRYRELLS
jgi:hypothetical protein